jgi:poly-beta-1,6-N-acetyl-D-glucosamine synthase
VIVSDGSTDETDDIVGKYVAEYPWIELVRMPDRRERNFAGKVHAFNAGYAKVRQLDYEVIGNLDADISFDEGYFSLLLLKMSENPELGLVGTPFKDGPNAIYDYRFVSIEHVSGACQLFRRECFEQIGGYVPVKGGCIDHIAVISARMKGWKTRTFTDKVSLHHRQMGTAQDGLLTAKFRNGRKDYVIGNHPVWELCRVAYQITKKPLVLGGVMLISGYVWAMIRRVPRPVSTELVTFYRREQMGRLRKFFKGNRMPAASTIEAPPCV